MGVPRHSKTLIAYSCHLCRSASTVDKFPPSTKYTPSKDAAGDQVTIYSKDSKDSSDWVPRGHHHYTIALVYMLAPSSRQELSTPANPKPSGTPYQERSPTTSVAYPILYPCSVKQNFFKAIAFRRFFRYCSPDGQIQRSQIKTKTLLKQR